MSTKKWLGYLLFTLCSYLIFLVGTLPATQLYSIARSHLPAALQLKQLNGSVWKGSAQQIAFNGYQVGPLYWQFKPLSLLLGQAEIMLTSTDKKLQLYGSAGIKLNGDVFLSNISGEGSSDMLITFIPNIPVTPVGRITFDFPEVNFSKQRLNTITGSADWLQAGFKQPIDIQIGKLNLQLSTDNSGGIHGIITDKGATVGVNAKLTLQPSGKYQIKGKIQPKPDTPTDLNDALKMLGRPDPTGAIPIRLSGKI